MKNDRWQEAACSWNSPQPLNHVCLVIFSCVFNTLLKSGTVEETDIRLGQQSDTDLVKLIHYLDRARQISLSSRKYRRYDTITLELAFVN